MAVATQNGSVGALSALCASAAVMQQRLLSPGLKAWSSMIRGMLWWSVPMLLDMGILRKDRWKGFISLRVLQLPIRKAIFVLFLTLEN